MRKHHISYEGIVLEYNLVRKNVKNINLHINNKQEITVSANPSVPLKTIEGFVESKAKWIIMHIAKAEQLIQTAPDGNLYEGKEVYILGKKYTLHFKYGNYNIEISGDNIIINIEKDCTDPGFIKNIYLGFLNKKAELAFNEALLSMLKKVEHLNIKKPSIYIRDMRTRWGSCIINKNKIGLNLQLIKAPAECINEVVLHELLHFVYPSHGSDFYLELTNLMPDWKERKNLLESDFKDGI
ncbi:MAG: SprT family zinc-dependent metalloprotease [Lachnospiraceae bacterium]|nr:SprT family zinc-dependent metalloprotease [Lachnospiraceae bacterium]